MTLAAICLSSASWVSNALFAEPVSRPSTSAAMVAIRPIPTFTTSFESGLRCSFGNTLWKSMPSSAPPKMHAKMIPAISSELISCRPSFHECTKNPTCFRALRPWSCAAVAVRRPDIVRRGHSCACGWVWVGRVALQPVHHACLGGPEGDPVSGGVLECNEERLGTPQRFLPQVLPPLELELVGELADERAVVAPGAPERDVRRDGRPV